MVTCDSEWYEMFNKYKKYKELSFAENFLGGHISVGPITIFGENAMHWAVNIKTKKYGYICFRLPLPSYKRWWSLYFYFSPDATPQNATHWFYGKDKI